MFALQHFVTFVGIVGDAFFIYSQRFAIIEISINWNIRVRQINRKLHFLSGFHLPSCFLILLFSSWTAFPSLNLVHKAYSNLASSVFCDVFSVFLQWILHGQANTSCLPLCIWLIDCSLGCQRKPLHVVGGKNEGQKIISQCVPKWTGCVFVCVQVSSCLFFPLSTV